MSSSVPSRSISIQDFLNNKQPIWDQAAQKVISTGGAVTIPLNFGKAQVVVNKRTKAMVPFNSLNYLLMYKDSLQRIQAEWVELNPDSAYLYGDRVSYTGSINVKDWDGKILKKFYYEKAKSINSTVKSSVMSSLNPVLPARIQVITSAFTKEQCIRVQVTNGCTCINKNNCDYCLEACAVELCWDEPECENCPEKPKYPSGGTGTGTGDTPGGGHSTGGSNNPNDYIPSPCNPEPGYVPTYFPDGTSTIPPCLPIPTTPDDPNNQGVPISTAQYLKTILRIQPFETQLNNFIDNPSNLSKIDALVIYANQNVGDASAVDVVVYLRWALEYLDANPSLNWMNFANQIPSGIRNNS